MAGLASEMLAALRSHEEIFRYWKGLRRRGRLPSRADIDPMQIKRRLPTISLIDVLDPNPDSDAVYFRQRLAGTELFDAYGQEITGMTFNKIYTASEAQYWAEALSFVVENRKPNVGLSSMAWRGAKGLSLFWLRLPLASDGVNVDMILGHDALIGKVDLLQSGIRSASVEAVS
ncbi:motility/cell cycle regulatory protein MopJ [Asticcacaulis solisilvae]|uniref:motility/cell cycle regulatory protein MopJ n=1 Tax=Asticcacaulis solisilvae TaxID=1217274 RepID=UPI003FD87950